MGTTKTAIFSKEVYEVSAFAKAMAHPARVAIIQHLLNRETCVCGDLVDEIELAQATISQHLKALKEIGIIQGTVEGTSTCYCLNLERWNQLKSQLQQLLLEVPHCGSSCC